MSELVLPMEKILEQAGITVMRSSEPDVLIVVYAGRPYRVEIGEL